MRRLASGHAAEIKNDVFPFFIDWLKFNVILVEIIAYSDENAYTIFETMNDRGLNLTPSEMLKGFLLSRFDEAQLRQKANANWKIAMQGLHEYEKDEDQRFIQAWFRAQYAETIRPGKAGSKNEDFEKRPNIFIAALGEKSIEMAFEWTCALGLEGIPSEMDFSDRSLKSQMKRADRLGTAYVLIVGEKEIKERSVILRNMTTKEQIPIPIDGVVKNIKIKLRREYIH